MQALSLYLLSDSQTSWKKSEKLIIYEILHCKLMDEQTNKRRDGQTAKFIGQFHQSEYQIIKNKH